MTGAAHVVDAVWHRPDVALCDAADGTYGTWVRASVPGLHKTCGGIFLGCLVYRSPHRFLPPLQFICRQPGLVRASCLSDCARLPHLALQNMAVGVNYGTGCRNDFRPAQKCGHHTCEDSEAHQATGRACATTGYRLHYTSRIIIELVALRLLGCRTCRQALCARLGRNDIITVIINIEGGAMLTNVVCGGDDDDDDDSRYRDAEIVP